MSAAVPGARGRSDRARGGPDPRAGRADQRRVRQVRRVQPDQEHVRVWRRAKEGAGEGPQPRRGDRDRDPWTADRLPGERQDQPPTRHLPREPFR